MGATAQQYFQSNTDQDQAWGTDIDKLDDTSGTLVSTTIAGHPSAGGTTTITLDPYTSRTVTGDATTNFGWAFDENSADGMQSTATEKRIVPSGTWTFFNRVTLGAPGLLGSLNLSIQYRVYRVDSATTRTLLFQVTSAEQAGALLGGDLSFTTTTSQSLIVLEADETIHVGINSIMRQVAGTLGGTASGATTYHTGGVGDAYVEVASPGVRTRYIRSHGFVGEGVTTVVRRTRLSRAAVAEGVASLARVLDLFRSLTAVGEGVTTVTRKIATSKTAVAEGVASLARVLSLHRTLSAVVEGVGTLVRKTGKPLSAVAEGVASLNRVLTLFRSLTAVAEGVSTLARRLSLFRVLTAVGEGVTTLVRKTGKPLTAVAEGVAELSRRLTLFRTLSAVAEGVSSLNVALKKSLTAVAEGVVSISRRLQFARTLTASGVGQVRARLQIAFDKVPGSIQTTFRRVFNIWED